MVTVIQIGRGHTGCNYLSIAPGDELHPLMVEGALFLGYIPLPGLAVVRRRDGGASVFNLASAVQTGARAAAARPAPFLRAAEEGCCAAGCQALPLCRFRCLSRWAVFLINRLY
jgi:hypothetical protein